MDGVYVGRLKRYGYLRILDRIVSDRNGGRAFREYSYPEENSGAVNKPDIGRARIRPRVDIGRICGPHPESSIHPNPRARSKVQVLVGAVQGIARVAGGRR